MMKDSPSSIAAQPVLGAKHALVLDFDGTLAPFQDAPDTVALPGLGADLLRALADQMDGALALISGRGAADLSKRTPVELWRIGAHGLEVCAPGIPAPSHAAPFPADLMARLAPVIDRFSGARLEQKGRVAAIHYRQNPAIGSALFEALQALVEPDPAYRVQHGKMVIELKPEGAHKGTALKTLSAEPPFAGRVPVMVGDDATDEDAMRAAVDLGGFGIKVGDGITCASYRLADPDAVWAWIRKGANEHA